MSVYKPCDIRGDAAEELSPALYRSWGQVLGERFDPAFHNAVMQREDAEAADQTVIQELQKGYLLKNRLLRPAMVVVARNPEV